MCWLLCELLFQAQSPSVPRGGLGHRSTSKFWFSLPLGDFMSGACIYPDISNVGHVLFLSQRPSDFSGATQLTEVGVGGEAGWESLPLIGAGDWQIAWWRLRDFFFSPISPNGWSHLLPGASWSHSPATATTGFRFSGRAGPSASSRLAPSVTLKLIIMMAVTTVASWAPGISSPCLSLPGQKSGHKSPEDFDACACVHVQSRLYRQVLWAAHFADQGG